MNGKIGLRIVSGLVLLGVIAAIGFFAFQAGIAQGSPVTIEGQSAPMPFYGYGYGYGMPFHHFGWGFGCLGPIFAVFLLVLALKAFRVMMWGPRWGWGGRHAHWGERGVPPMFDEWHKRSHNGPAGGGEQTEDKKES